MKENFAIVPNVTRAFGTKYYLNEFEVNVYVAIYLYRNFCLDYTSITTVKLIHRHMNLSEKNYKKDSTKIVDALHALHDKEYIRITCDGDIKKDILEIKIYDMSTASTEIKFGDKIHVYKGFEKVSLLDFEECKNTYMNAFLHVMWRSGLKDYRISFKEFAFVLNKSEKQAERIVNKAVDLEIFYKESGSYTFENAVVRQEPNKYNLVPDNLEEKEKKVKSMDFKEKNKKNITDERISSNELYLSMLFEKENFTYEAYYCFKETTCSYVKEKFEKKLEIICKNENGKYAIDKLEERYQDEIEYRRIQKEENEMLGKRLDNMSEEELKDEFPYLFEEDEEEEKKRIEERNKRKQEKYDGMRKMFD